MKVPLPPDEKERLQALKETKILDTAREELFDNITALAANICQTPISLISFIDYDRQWFKSAVGLDLKETPRDISFCTHAILKSSLMEVPDATKDKRFENNPLVTHDPKIRFYAGMPLTNREGYNLGTLCVLDHKPRTLTSEQKEMLDRLSKLVIILIETKKILLDEASAKKIALESLEELKDKLEGQLVQEKKINDHILLLSEMSGMLQSSITKEEAYSVIAKFCLQLYPHAEGALYLDKDKNYLEQVRKWNGSVSFKEIIRPDECWALRRGRPHFALNREIDFVCAHVTDPSPNKMYICLPLTAKNETLGLLYLEFEPSKNQKSVPIGETQRLFAAAVSEQISLALVNIHLREVLGYQSTHDTLTGLHNRRHIESIFHSELQYALRKKSSLAIMMIDIDSFKKFNDTFGHEAGDKVIQEVGHVLLKNIRPYDLACRYGGDEFLLLMRDVSLKEAYQKAEQIRTDIKKLKFDFTTKELKPVSISVGIAMMPKHGDNFDDLIYIADKALYQAKRSDDKKIICAK